MSDIAIFRINYKSDFILTLQSDAGWMTPFCIKFWTGAPSQAYFVCFDGRTYTHCAPVDGEPTKLRVQFDDHHLPIGNLKFQIGYHFNVADFPTSVEDEVLNQASVIIEVDDVPAQVMLDLNGETAPEIEFSLPAYANEAQRIANEQQRIANEQTRIANEEARIAAETIRQQNEEQRIEHETARVDEFAQLKRDSEQATSDANTAANLANEKAQLAADKAALAQVAATLAGDKAQLADDKAALAQAAAILANEKAALAQQKAAYAQTQGDYAKEQGDYAKAQGDTAQADHVRAEADHTTAADDHSRAEGDHTTAASDHSRAESDHTTAASDHSRAEADHTTASSDHSRAESDHTTAASDHTRAESDHTTAASDHETAASDHTRAESDHAAVEVYVDSLGAFDLSKYNAVGGVLATYADLSAALTALNALEGKYKYGGMSFKFVQSSSTKYVQYRYMGTSTTDATFTNVANWQGVDEEPTAGSDNLMKSRGVFNFRSIIRLTLYTDGSLDSLTDGQYGYNNVNDVLRYKQGTNLINIALSYHCLYIYNNRFFKYNGTKLEEIVDADKIKLCFDNVNTLLNVNLNLKQGVPQNPSQLTRVQTEYIKVTNGFNIKVNNGFYIYTIYKYNPTTFAQIADITVNATEWTSDGDYVIKVIFKKGFAGTDAISPADNIVRSVSMLLFELYPKAAVEDRNINSLAVIGTLKLQNKSMNVSTGGELADSDVRICTGFLKPPFTLSLNSDYLVYDVYKYNTDYSYKGRTSIVTVNTKTLTLPDTNEIVRLVLKKGSAGMDTLSIYDDLVFSYSGQPASEKYEADQTKAKVEQNSLNIDLNSLNIDLNSLIIEQGGINTRGSDSPSNARLRTKNYIYGTKQINLPAGFMIYMAIYYDAETLAFDSYVDVLNRTYTVGKPDCVARLSICKSYSTQPITVTELKQITDIEELSKEVKGLNATLKTHVPLPPMVQFDFDHNIKDFSNILNDVIIAPTIGMMERVYALFDKLVALYPDYVYKYDPMAASDSNQNVEVNGTSYTIVIHAMSDIKAAMQEAGFSDYPIYAKGVTGTVSETIENIDGTTYTVEYTDTPAYKTYMYKFACERSYINTNINKKEKVFLISNTHGNEVAAPLNLYLLMQQLCTGVVADGNFYKLRAAFDFYVIPHLNGYGCYHSTRCNARRVDINRNFPISAWHIAGKDTIDNDNFCEFTGPNAGSEFETQLVVNLVKSINPSFACDLHNHGGGDCQLYSGLINKNGILFTQLAQQASVDMAIAFGKKFPEYFGTGYHDILFGSTADAPGYNANLNLPHTYCWWNEYGVKFPCLIEVGTKIDWRNGEQEGRVDTWFSSDFFSIAEYSVRIQLLRYLQFLMDNKNKI